MVKNKSGRSLASIATLVLVLFLALAPGVFSPLARGQETPVLPASSQTVDKAQLHQALLDLTNPWTVMCVAAHPDDEDGTTLTVLRRKFGVHTVSLFSTYGEGGQNAVGPELYEELGVIRVHETMKAAQIQGSEPYFLGLKDFGFSKSAEEAFKVWGHDEALRRMVLKIRELRPDVIITNHDEVSGHGHHQATGRLIIEAFDAAADPKRFPEQLSKLKPWQAQRLFVRMFGGGKVAASAAKIVAIDPNEIDLVRGTSFAEQALAALQQHATQGPWPKSMAALLKARRIEGGQLPAIRYQLVREASQGQPLPVSAVTFLDGLIAPAAFSTRLESLAIDERALTFFLDQPARVLDALINWRVNNPPVETPADDPDRLRLFEGRFNKALATAAGISLTVDSRSNVLVPGSTTTFSITVANTGARPVQVNELRFDNGDEKRPVEIADKLLSDTETTVTTESATPANATLTVPKEAHLYDGLLLGKRFDAEADVDMEGATFRVHAEKNIDIAPAVEIDNISPSPCVRTQETLGKCKQFNVTLTNHLATPFRGTMKMSASARPAGRQVGEATRQIVLGPQETRTETVLAGNAILNRGALSGLRKSGSIVISIYRPEANAPVTQRTVPVVFSDARVVPELRVGYVPSFDQTIARSLAALGVEAKALTVNDIQTADLSSYNTIIIDNRGYEAHPELVASNSRLLQYVQQGGNLIVFYHKDNEWNPDATRNRPQLAPYSIVLGGERVTDETAPIRFIQPRHPLLNFPNKITQADFGNWIQERGLYYPKEWDSHYSDLFSTNDPGETPLKGGLLVTRYGRGNYIYTSMVWYRQLRAGVPGAYRMFANMISYGHK